MRILIVEDNILFRAILRSSIARRFPAVEILEAGAVAPGLAMARTHRPDLILVDVQLPDGSGLDLARQLVTELPRATVALCTSYDNPAYRAAAVACRVDHFIPKDDMSPDRVLDLVQSVAPDEGAPDGRVH